MSARTEPRSFTRKGRGVMLGALEEGASTAGGSGVCDIVAKVWHLAIPPHEVTKERHHSSADWLGLFSSNYFRPGWVSPWPENKLYGHASLLLGAALPAAFVEAAGPEAQFQSSGGSEIPHTFPWL